MQVTIHLVVSPCLTVPCVKRTSAVDSTGGAEELVETPMEGEEDAWVAPAVQRTASGAPRGEYDDDIVDIDANGEEVVAEVPAAVEDEDAIPDIDDLAIEDDDEVRRATGGAVQYVC